MENPNAISFISGVKFGSGANIRFRTKVDSLSADEASVVIATWANTKLKQFRIGVLFFEENDYTSSLIVSTEKTGPMYNGKDERHDI
mmetsp:Transcript_22453/g.19400  ORF Transcript_22453/g.19400 Transcript_22453/m.19400 type:complete len:87 (+) Transcript_22453:515-775(+)